MAVVVFVHCPVEEHLGERAGGVAQRAGHVAHGFAGYHLTVHGPHRRRLGEILEKVRAHQGLAVHAGKLHGRLVGVDDVALHVDGHQQILAGFNKSAVTLFAFLHGNSFTGPVGEFFDWLVLAELVGL